MSTLDQERFKDNFQDSAILKPDDTGYSELATGYGTLTVQLIDVKPYANGSRLKLRWGNPTSAEITKFDTDLRWGAVDAKGSADFASSRERKHTWEAKLAPGQWTHTTVDLGDFPPAKLGFLSISNAEVKGVMLLGSSG